VNEILEKYLPLQAVIPCMSLIQTHEVHLKIVNTRVTRHGDYRRNIQGKHAITINASLNPYRFLMTLIHEIAHLVAFEDFGYAIKPHGIEWKQTFRNLMLPFIRPEVFPSDLLPYLARHFKNPKASTDTDAALSVAFSNYDLNPPQENYIFELSEGTLFKIYNGKIFKKGPKRVKRYECIEISSGKTYLFQPNAKVSFLIADNAGS